MTAKTTWNDIYDALDDIDPDAMFELIEEDDEVNTMKGRTKLDKTYWKDEDGNHHFQKYVVFNAKGNLTIRQTDQLNAGEVAFLAHFVLPDYVFHPKIKASTIDFTDTENQEHLRLPPKDLIVLSNIDKV